jgi:hypothetical protein
MNKELSGYFLKEYGAWSVLIISSLIGLGVSRALAWRIVPVLIGLCLLINSKPAFAKWVRGRGDTQSLVIFLAQIIIAGVIFLSIFGSDTVRLLPLLIFPIAYLLMSRFAGEHFIVTELLGFVLISLAAVIAKFTITGGVDIRLLTAVAVYFMAGVFKVKWLLFRKTHDRVLCVLYLGLAVLIYSRIHLSHIILLPLLDNLIVAVYPYKVKLQTTGWIEVGKSLAFLGLMTAFF